MYDRPAAQAFSRKFRYIGGKRWNLKNPDSPTDKQVLMTKIRKCGKVREEMELIRQEHLTQVSFFQHERLIHLIVTVTFAILEILSLLMTLINADLFALLLAVVVLVLLIPYIRHYYILENEVQKMYKQYDAICKELYDGKFYDSTVQAPITGQ